MTTTQNLIPRPCVTCKKLTPYLVRLGGDN